MRVAAPIAGRNGPPAAEGREVERNDDWNPADRPEDQAVIWRMVPARQPARAARARRRRRLLRSAEQGFRRAEERRLLKIVPTPDSKRMHPVHRHERDEAAVQRGASAGPWPAWALPIRRSWTRFCSASAIPMFGGSLQRSTEAVWPQPHQYDTDIAKAKAIDGGRPATETVSTPRLIRSRIAGRQRAACVLIAESLAQIGIKATINKIPGANWRTELNKNVAALHQRLLRLARLSRIFLLLVPSRPERRSVQHDELQEPAMDAMIDAAARNAAAIGDKPTNDASVKGFADPRLEDAAHPAGSSP